jgi:hypothetical protein
MTTVTLLLLLSSSSSSSTKTTITTTTTTQETNMPVDEDTGTSNRVTIGIWQRESARQNIKTLLVTKPKFLFYVHLGTSGIDGDGIRSPALRTFQNNNPRKAKELSLPSRRIRLIPQHYLTLFALRSLHE